MDSQENNNDTLRNQEPQEISPNIVNNNPENATIDNNIAKEASNNTDIIQTPNNGPVIETIPMNNITEQQTTIEPQIETIETLDTTTFSAPQNPEPQPIADNFNAVPTPPEITENKKNKKKNNKTLLYILFVLVLIAAVGFGVKFFLTNAKKNAPGKEIGIKEVKLELGAEITNNIDDYATITGYNKAECTIDKSGISTKKVGAYKFYITCSGQKVEGTAVVDDTTKPEVIMNEVLVAPNANITVNDFISSCVDASKCTYKFANEDTVKTALKAAGEYKIEIIISDEYNNESTVTANLIVSNEAPVRYLTCTGPSEDIDEIYATLTNSYKFGISSANNIYGIVKNAEFKYSEVDDYNKAKNSYNEKDGIHNIKGEASFSEKNKTITIKSKETLKELNTELGLTLGEDANTLQMYMTILGYTCN